MVQRSGTPLAGRSIVVGSERGGRDSGVGRVGGVEGGSQPGFGRTGLAARLPLSLVDFATRGREMPALRSLGEAVALMSVSSVTEIYLYLVTTSAKLPIKPWESRGPLSSHGQSAIHWPHGLTQQVLLAMGSYSNFFCYRLISKVGSNSNFFIF